METLRSKIFNIIAKLDNGSHSSNQLQGVDEALTKLFLEERDATIEEAIEKIKEYIFKVEEEFGQPYTGVSNLVGLLIEMKTTS